MYLRALPNENCLGITIGLASSMIAVFHNFLETLVPVTYQVWGQFGCPIASLPNPNRNSARGSCCSIPMQVSPLCREWYLTPRPMGRVTGDVACQSPNHRTRATGASCRLSLPSLSAQSVKASSARVAQWSGWYGTQMTRFIHQPRAFGLFPIPLEPPQLGLDPSWSFQLLHADRVRVQIQSNTCCQEQFVGEQS